MGRLRDIHQKWLDLWKDNSLFCTTIVHDCTKPALCKYFSPKTQIVSSTKHSAHLIWPRLTLYCFQELKLPLRKGRFESIKVTECDEGNTSISLQKMHGELSQALT